MWGGGELAGLALEKAVVSLKALSQKLGVTIVV
jgi:hypothetical protein